MDRDERRAMVARFLLALKARQFEYGRYDCLTLAGGWAMHVGATSEQKHCLEVLGYVRAEYDDWMELQRHIPAEWLAKEIDRGWERADPDDTDGCVGLHRVGKHWALVVCLDDQAWGWRHPDGWIDVVGPVPEMIWKGNW